MPKAIKGDHTILGTQASASSSYPDAANRARPSTSASNATLPARKTPSPKPPSPTNSAWSSTPRTKGTPSPPPPPMLSSRSSASAAEPLRRSPKTTERVSPTPPGKAASSPTAETATLGSSPKPLPKGHARSLSTSTTPTPPSVAGHGSLSGRLASLSLGPRSKSQASEPHGSSRVGSEARRPVPRRPDSQVETRDAITQTDGDDLGLDAWGESLMDMEDELEHEASDGVTDPNGGPGGDGSTFLSKHIQMQAELEMALRSQMELIAEGPTATSAAPAKAAAPHNDAAAGSGAAAGGAPFPSPPRSMKPLHAGRRGLPMRSMGRPSREGDTKAAEGVGGDGSDGECHPEDDEVRSLSLSEDGPVIRRSLSEGAGAFGRAAVAPDPIAMLTDGTRKAMLSARTVITTRTGDATPSMPHGNAPHSPRTSGDLDCVLDVTDSAGDLGITFAPTADGEGINSTDGEPLGSDRSVPNESDNSAAPTHCNDAVAPPPSSDTALYKSLIPILSKVTGSATASPPATEHPAASNGGGALPGQLQGRLEVVQEAPGVASTRSSTAAALRRGWTPTKSLRVPALRSAGSKIQALDLSQITLPPLGEHKAALPGASGGASGAMSEGGAGACDARSDVSFGSAHSAFTCLSSSSPSSSQLASPRPHHLKTTVSMPALNPRIKQRE